MLVKELMDRLEKDMKDAVEGTQHELSLIRTGRASTALVDGINVECYGGSSPLKQVANVTIPEARLIMIQPWDKSILKNVEKALLKSDLGLTPQNDGKIIRLALPELTEDRRKELAKLAKKLGEEGKVKVRNLRRHANDELHEGQKDGDIPKDEAKRHTDKTQELTDAYTDEIDKIIAQKQKEITEF
jgi:ribosome recycling factor